MDPITTEATVTVGQILAQNKKVILVGTGVVVTGVAILICRKQIVGLWNKLTAKKPNA